MIVTTAKNDFPDALHVISVPIVEACRIFDFLNAHDFRWNLEFYNDEFINHLAVRVAGAMGLREVMHELRRQQGSSDGSEASWEWEWGVKSRL